MADKKKIVREEVDLNKDPITEEHGSHPVGAGIGAAGVGAAATAIGGAVGGPIGAVAGAAIGAVAGGLAGKGVAEKVDPTVEEAYWKETYESRSYKKEGYGFDDYSPAYRVGYEGYATHSPSGMTYQQAEPHLRSTYESTYGNSRLGWSDASPAAQDAWLRVSRNNSPAGRH